MSEDSSGKQQVIDAFNSLPAWTTSPDFSPEDWDKFIQTARLVQATDPDIVEAALNEFIQEAKSEEYRGYESESKPFILMRVVFDIPEVANASERFSFKGWANWPPPDANNQVNLSWPVSWESGKPKLLAAYYGSEGRPYAAASEYRFLMQKFPYRKL